MIFALERSAVVPAAELFDEIYRQLDVWLYLEEGNGVLK